MAGKGCGVTTEFCLQPRSWQIGLIGVAVLATAILGFSRWRLPKSVPPLGLATVTIVPGVHMIRGLGPSAAYAVETSEGTILVDAGLEAAASTLKSELANLLIDYRTIKAVFLTHVHGDHTGGAEAIRRATGAKTYAGKGDADVLRAGGPREAFFSAFYMPNHAPHPTPIDVELVGGEDLVFGDTHIVAVGTPGHTPGSICYLLERGGHRILFSGDVIMHLSEHKPLGTYSTYLAPKHRGDAKTYLETIKSLRSMQSPDLVLPGHPPPGPRPNLATMTPGRWTAIMDEGIQDMEILLARFAADGKDFLDGEPKRLLSDLVYLGDSAGVATYAFVEEGRLILVDAPDSADGVAERLVRLGITPAAPSLVLLTSNEPAHLAGLKSIVDRWHCRVVAAPTTTEAARASCPSDTDIVSTDDFSTLGFGKALSAITLRGGGAGYLFTREGKVVLFSGPIPVQFGEEAIAKLKASPTPSRDDTLDAMTSIHRLSAASPDLWLPSNPWHGQNANLYGDEWADLIAANYRIRHSQLEQPR